MQDNDKGDKGGKSQDNKFTVTVSYGGLSKSLEVNRNQAVQAVFEHAMQLFHSPGGELRLFIGATELPLNASVEQAGITPGITLLLRPRQVRGG
jgi:hypothetical protein